MSGGSFDYGCYKLTSTYGGAMEDEELEEFIIDFSDVLHDLEWWKDCDIGEEDYRKTIKQFKDKWFGTRDDNLRELLIKVLDETKKRILEP